MKKKYPTHKQHATPPLTPKKSATSPQKKPADSTYVRSNYSIWAAVLATGIFLDNPDSLHLFIRPRRGMKSQINLSHPASRWIMGFMGLVGGGLMVVSFLLPLSWARWNMMLLGLFWLLLGFILPLRYLIARRMRITRKRRPLL